MILTTTQLKAFYPKWEKFVNLPQIKRDVKCGKVVIDTANGMKVARE
jgi:hypothetical protein